MLIRMDYKRGLDSR